MLAALNAIMLPEQAEDEFTVRQIADLRGLNSDNISPVLERAVRDGVMTMRLVRTSTGRPAKAYRLTGTDQPAEA